MGTWSVGITGNDTAEDLKYEYTSAFFYYDVTEALQKTDAYVRREVCNETDEEEWCNYFYSLANFMWSKGILTDEIKQQAVDMIDSGFGLEVWAESGEKTLLASNINNFYVEGQFQGFGFGTTLLKYVIDQHHNNLYIDIPKDDERLRHICDKLGLTHSV